MRILLVIILFFMFNFCFSQDVINTKKVKDITCIIGSDTTVIINKNSIKNICRFINNVDYIKLGNIIDNSNRHVNNSELGVELLYNGGYINFYYSGYVIIDDIVHVTNTNDIVKLLDIIKNYLKKSI